MRRLFVLGPLLVLAAPAWAKGPGKPLEVETFTTGGVCRPSFVCGTTGPGVNDFTAIEFDFVGSGMGMDLAGFFAAQIDALRKKEPDTAFSYKVEGREVKHMFHATKVELVNKGKKPTPKPAP